jgi:excisionase family DNA binding protein
MSEALAVSIQGAGNLVGLSRSSIYKALETGDLSSFYAGRSRRILVSELDRWLKELPKEKVSV